MADSDYDEVVQFFYKCMESNSYYGAMSRRTGDGRARKLADAFALALLTTNDVTQIIEGGIDPETAYYNVFRHVMKDVFKHNDSNEVVEATMALIDEEIKASPQAE